MKIVVREAVLDDAKLIADLIRNAWTSKVAARLHDPHETENTILSDLQQGGGFILMVNDRPAGCARWRPEDENNHIWKIHRLGILSEFRGKSLSEYLLEAIIHHAHICEITELHVALHSDHERLVDYYAALDFEVAPELEFSAHDLQDSPPIMLRKFFD